MERKPANARPQATKNNAAKAAHLVSRLP